MWQAGEEDPAAMVTPPARKVWWPRLHWVTWFSAGIMIAWTTAANVITGAANPVAFAVSFKSDFQDNCGFPCFIYQWNGRAYALNLEALLLNAAFAAASVILMMAGVEFMKRRHFRFSFVTAIVVMLLAGYVGPIILSWSLYSKHFVGAFGTLILVLFLAGSGVELIVSRRGGRFVSQ